MFTHFWPTNMAALIQPNDTFAPTPIKKTRTVWKMAMCTLGSRICTLPWWWFEEKFQKVNFQMLRININPKDNTSPFSAGRDLQVWPALIVEKETAVREALVACAEMGTRNKAPEQLLPKSPLITKGQSCHAAQGQAWRTEITWSSCQWRRSDKGKEEHLCAQHLEDEAGRKGMVGLSVMQNQNKVLPSANSYWPSLFNNLLLHLCLWLKLEHRECITRFYAVLLF